MKAEIRTRQLRETMKICNNKTKTGKQVVLNYVQQHCGGPLPSSQKTLKNITQTHTHELLIHNANNPIHLSKPTVSTIVHYFLFQNHPT